jgi:HAD superfamily hydrolase (TIGR01450 family)
VLPTITIDELIERYEVLLLDAYGVLMHHGGALAGAAELVHHLNRTDKPYYILTNDASRLPETSADRFAYMGLQIPTERIITSGSLLAPYFEEHRLQGARCLVLGPRDSGIYVEQAGGRVMAVDDRATSPQVLVVCDEVGYGFVQTVDRVLSLLFASFDADESVRLILPNPDLVYPKDEKSYGITAGSIALIFEQALKMRYPGMGDTGFVALGKPHAPIFEEAVRRAGSRDLVMVGDQLATDIKGASDFGIDSVLVQTGLARVQDADSAAVRPTYVLKELAAWTGEAEQ